METKTCSRCGRTLPIEKFRPRSQKKNWNSVQSSRQAWCRECEKRYYRHENKNAKWTRLAWNLRRNKGGDVTARQLRDRLGPPQTCYICGQSMDWGDAELDHIHPLSKGGLTTIENLAWSHRRCNRLKHDLTIDELIEHMKLVLRHLEEQA